MEYNHCRSIFNRIWSGSILSGMDYRKKKLISFIFIHPIISFLSYNLFLFSLGSPLPIEFQYCIAVESVLLPPVGNDSRIGSLIFESSTYLGESIGIHLFLLGSAGNSTCSYQESSISSVKK